MTDLTCYRCGFNHETGVTCGDARTARIANLANRARAAIAEAKSHLCSHGNRADQCRQDHGRPTADVELPEEAAR